MGILPGSQSEFVGTSGLEGGATRPAGGGGFPELGSGVGFPGSGVEFKFWTLGHYPRMHKNFW